MLAAPNSSSLVPVTAWATKRKPADVARSSLCLLAGYKHRGVASLHLVAEAIVGSELDGMTKGIVCTGAHEDAV